MEYFVEIFNVLLYNKKYNKRFNKKLGARN